MRPIFELALKRILKQRVTLLLMIIFPIAIVFIPQPESMNTPSIAYGIFGLVILFSAFLLTKQIIDDRQHKTIIRIAAAPITHRDYLLGHVAAYMGVMVIQITMFFILSIVVYDAFVMYYVLAYILLLGFTFMSLTFALFWHTFFKSYETSIALFSIVANLMSLIGGMSFPLAFLPTELRRVAIIFPTYWYAYGLELSSEKAYGNAILCLLILGGFAIIFLLIGSKKRFE
ncbi:MAG: ABC transporter permease [Bacillota bacterium]